MSENILMIVFRVMKVRMENDGSCLLHVGLVIPPHLGSSSHLPQPSSLSSSSSGNRDSNVKLVAIDQVSFVGSNKF